MLTILQQLILGILQGVTEWIPLSSSAVLTLVMTNFFGITDLHDLITTALFFHLGTFLAALIYFRSDVKKIFRTLFHYKRAKPESKKIFNFLLVSTMISGILGYLLISLFFSFESSLEFTGKTISFFVGIFLLFTGIIQIKIHNKGIRKEEDLERKDGVFLGLAQAFSALPGISRSGITVSSLLLKKFDSESALKLSFLMSLPIVLLGNIVLNLEDLIFTGSAIYGLLASFVFGIITIHFLMNLSRKINFGWFVIVFSVLMILSVLI